MEAADTCARSARVGKVSDSGWLGSTSVRSVGGHELLHPPQVSDLLGLIRTNCELEEQERPLKEVSLNRVFLGNPGTGG